MDEMNDTPEDLRCSRCNDLIKRYEGSGQEKALLMQSDHIMGVFHLVSMHSRAAHLCSACFALWDKKFKDVSEQFLNGFADTSR